MKLVVAMVSHNSEETKIEEGEEIEEGEIDLSTLTSEEKDALILEMQAEEMMQKQKAQSTSDSPTKVRIRKRKRRAKKSSNADIAPGLGWVAIKMGTAMTFSMTFIFLGPLLIIMALLKAFADTNAYDWFDLLWGCIGIGLTVAAFFLFRYIVK